MWKDQKTFLSFYIYVNNTFITKKKNSNKGNYLSLSTYKIKNNKIKSYFVILKRVMILNQFEAILSWENLDADYVRNVKY